jgi:hypothetical protein
MRILEKIKPQYIGYNDGATAISMGLTEAL